MSSGSAAFPRWEEVTGIFGGRFDPPHLGHREAVLGLFENPRLKRVLIIPSASPPHKPVSASAKNRFAMAGLNFKSLGNSSISHEIRIDDREILRAQIDPKIPSFTYDTLQDLRKSLTQLAFIIGADQLTQLPTWHRFPEILQLCHWIVIVRKPEGDRFIREALPLWQASGLITSASPSSWRIVNSPYFLNLIPTAAPPISSTVIRENLAKFGKVPENTLLTEVEGYLNEHRLYGM